MEPSNSSNVSDNEESEENRGSDSERSLISNLKFPITIEPLVLLYTIAVGLNEVIRSNLIIEKICQQKLNYTDTQCSNLTNLDDIEKIVQENVSDYESLYMILSFVPKILYALLAGTWSDQHGRKILIAMPLLGQFLASLSYALNYYFLERLPWQFLFLELVNDFCGNYVAYYLAVYSYITDVTKDDGRTYRLSIVDGVDYVSTSIGTRISAPLFLSLGYYAVFGFSAASCVLALVYLIFFVRESLLNVRERRTDKLESQLNISTVPPNYGSQQVLEQEITKKEEQEHSKISKNWFWSSVAFIAESLRTVIKPRRKPQRIILLLGIFNFACFIFTYNGIEGTHRYYFAQRKYGWTEQEMTTYLFDYRIGYMVTLWVLVPLMTKVFGMSDPLIAIIACITSSLGLILPAVTDTSGHENPSETEWIRNGSFVLNWFSLGGFISMLYPLTTIATRSIISRAVPGEEIGRIYSVLALFSAASGSLVESGYQQLYKATISSLLGAYLLVNAALLLLTVPVNVVIGRLLNKIEL